MNRERERGRTSRPQDRVRERERLSEDTDNSKWPDLHVYELRPVIRALTALIVLAPPSLSGAF